MVLDPTQLMFWFLIGYYSTGSVIEKFRNSIVEKNKAYTLGLSQLLVFIAVAMNTDGFFSYQCISGTTIVVPI